MDYVTVFAEPLPVEILQRIKPDVLAKGGDYAAAEVEGRAFVEGYGGQVHVLAHRPGLGSTEIIRKLEEV